MSADGSRPVLSRRSLLQVLGGGALALALPRLTGCGGSAPRRPPNVLFVLTDDHRHDALGCAGHPWLDTPNLDRIAAEGVRFSDAFVTTSLCSPSRASFLSGQFAHEHGVCGNEENDLPASTPTFATELQSAGYRTGFIGKWHQARLARPRPGFERWEAFGRQGEYHRNTWNVNGRWELSTEYVTDDITGRAERFLAEQDERPFLLMVSHKAVHAPFEPAPRHADLYRDVRLQPATEPGDRLELKPDWGGRRAATDTRALIRDYARTLAAVDESMGRLLETLRLQNRLDDTVIVYAGDNGYLLGEHGGLLDKRAAYEESIRIPLLIRYPRLFEPGGVCRRMVLNLDVAPTIVGLAGLPPPATMRGLDLAALARAETGRDAFLYEYFAELGTVPTTVALRTPDYKYVTYPDDPELTRELYDLRADPGELVNRIDDPDLAEVRQRLARRLELEKSRTDFAPCAPPRP